MQDGKTMKTPTNSTLLVAGLALASSFAPFAYAQTPTSTPTPTPTPMHSSGTSSTAENKADASSNAVTPFSQSNAQADLDVTQNIRKAILNEKNMSVDAQNIKIITTTNHVVYLKGVVDSETERQRILAIAKPLAGDRTIKNRLKLPDETHKS